MEQNKAIVYTGIKEVAIKDIKMPELGPDEVLVHVRATALCTQEQRWYTGVKKVNNYPSVAGHESAGDVVAVGENVKSFKIGDRVAISSEPTGPAEAGDWVEQEPNPDENGNYQILHGSLVRFIKRNKSALIKVAQDTPFEYACLCEPISCVMHSVKRAEIQFGDVVVIIGAGIMGLLHTQFAKMQGAYVIVSEVDPARREKAKEMGADYCLNPLEEDPIEYLKNNFDKRGADVVFNTTALHSVWKQAIGMLAYYGKIVCYSSQHPDEEVGVLMGKGVHSNQWKIIGTEGSTNDEMYVAAKMIEKGLIKCGPVVDSLVPFENAKEAFEKAIVPNTYRVVLTDFE